MKKTKFRYIESFKNKIQYKSNRINNQKYEIYSFFFRVLLQQFKYFFNSFFFMIACIQWFEKFAIGSPFSSIGPWLLVLCICLFKEGMEDYERYERDKVLNNQMYIKYGDKFEYIRSMNIQVGDIILLQKGERVPADMVLLKTSDISGQLFIKTDQLDGETDWKVRSTLPFIHNGDLSLLKDLKVIAEAPNKEIYNFQGSITADKFEKDLVEIEEAPKKGIFTIIKGWFKSHKKNEPIEETVDPTIYEWVYKKNTEDEGIGPIIQSFSIDEEIVGDNKQSCTQIVEDSKQSRTQIVEDSKQNNIDIVVRDNILKSSHDDTKNDKNNESTHYKAPTQYNGSIHTPPINTLSLNTPHYNGTHGLTLENMIWSNTLITTSSALGLVVYTGDDTRAMMNTSKPRNKSGLFDYEINAYSKFLGGTSALVALLFTYLKGELQQDSPLLNKFIVFFKFVVLFSSIIPISLKITIDMARYAYSYEITNNENIKGTVVRNSNVPEELGRISYFLSDKTGTLTKNEMEMKRVHIGTALFSEDNFKTMKNNLLIFLNKKKEEKQIFGRNKRDIYTKTYDAVESLSICHNVTPVYEGENNILNYQASSPDEVAIVQWTESVGMKLIERHKSLIVIENPQKELQEYEILYIFPFTSESKRMGIIVRNNNTITFIVKGADVVMNKIIIRNEWCEEEVENMAREGLRTLIIAKKILSPDEYGDFDKQYSKAKASLENRNGLIEEAMKMIEKDLNAVGLTGVEDKLQDDVKITLETLRNAGIKVWMLTGDKIETAISIAISSRILTKDSFYTVLDNIRDSDALFRRLKEIERSNYNSLVVDGTSMSQIVEYAFDRFIDYASKMDVIVGCRFSPTQKALVARHLKDRTNKVVCCIGDGGNDVSMITEANIGIGIVGKEGNQASLAADYSILKFCYVTELILWHGRNSYKNSSILAYLIIHRGTILSVLQGLFCSFINFIPFNLYKGLVLIAFVSLYTFFPIFSTVFTSDVTKETARKFPEIYKELIENSLLSIKDFASWNMMSFYQGTAIMIITLMTRQELFAISTITFTSLIINEILMVLLTVSRINKYVIISCLVSIFIYMLSFILFRHTFYLDQPIYTFIPKVLGINIIAISLMLVKRVFEYYRPSTSSKLESSQV